MTAIWGPEFDPWAADPSTWPPVIVRTYRGNPSSVTAQMQAEAIPFGVQGYVITSQVHVPGSWGCGAFALAVLLILVVGLGLLILAYLVIVKPAGTLTVTYVRQAPASPSVQRFAVG